MYYLMSNNFKDKLGLLFGFTVVQYVISSIAWAEAYSDRVQCWETKRINMAERARTTILSSLALTDDKTSFVSHSDETDESRLIGRLEDKLISPGD